MKTKKITLNELKSLIGKIINEEIIKSSEKEFNDIKVGSEVFYKGRKHKVIGKNEVSLTLKDEQFNKETKVNLNQFTENGEIIK